MRYREMSMETRLEKAIKSIPKQCDYYAAHSEPRPIPLYIFNDLVIAILKSIKSGKRNDIYYCLKCGVLHTKIKCPSCGTTKAMSIPKWRKIVGLKP